jgi:hypothetical protein
LSNPWFQEYAKDDRLAFTLVHDTIGIVTVKAGVSESKHSIPEESQIERRAAILD